MKTNVNSWALYLLFMAVQLVMTNYLHLSQFVTLSILPALIMCLPLSFAPWVAMLFAFATGLTVDFFAEGVIGLNTVALLPVAALRLPVISLMIGSDAIERGMDFNFKKNGPAKVTMVTFIPLFVFLFIYIAADGAGMRPFWFNCARFAASLAVDLFLCLMVVKTLNPDDRR